MVRGPTAGLTGMALLAGFLVVTLTAPVPLARAKGNSTIPFVTVARPRSPASHLRP